MLKKYSSNRLFAIGLWFVALCASLYFPFASLLGSHKAMLGGGALVLPVLGSLCGIGSVSLLFVLLWIIKACLKSLPLTVGIPSLFGMVSWSSARSTKTRAIDLLVNALLPAICMATFMCHPASREAWPYALYWLIPISCHLMSSKKSFILALQSAFVSHAIGSIMWLFLVPMTSAQWLGLIPVVAVERLVMATVATAIYTAINVLTYKAKAGQSAITL